MFTVLLFHSVVATLLTCERGTRYQCGTGTYTDLPLFLEPNATVSTLSGLLTGRRSVARRTGLSDGNRLVWVLSRKQITVTLSLLTHFTEGVSLGPLTLHKMGLKEIGVDGNVILKWVLKELAWVGHCIKRILQELAWVGHCIKMGLKRFGAGGALY